MLGGPARQKDILRAANSISLWLVTAGGVSVSVRGYLEPLSVWQGRLHPGSKEDGSHSQHRPGNDHQYAMSPNEPLSVAYASYSTAHWSSF